MFNYTESKHKGLKLTCAFQWVDKMFASIYGCEWAYFLAGNSFRFTASINIVFKSFEASIIILIRMSACRGNK